MPEFDLIIAGGEVVDPDAGLSGRLDVAILDGKIAAIEPSISSGRAGKVIEAGGRLVTPGLVDLHAHVLHGVADLAVPPDEVGVRSGVTTVIDAGSAGAAIFRAFPDWIIPAARTRIVPFMHIAQTGLATSPDISGPSDVSVELTREMLRQHAGLVAGIKVRLVSPAIEVLGLDMLRIAKQLAAEAGIPVMVHIGDILQRGDPGLGREALALLGAGDIVTHVFTPNPGGILDSAGVVFPELFEAVERGVLFDAAHGRANLGFDVARRALGQGVPLTSISTDMTRFGRTDIVFSLTEIMSRYLALGFSVAEVISRSTSRPAAAAGIADRAGRIEVGRPADVSVLELRDGDWTVFDAVGEELRLRRAFIPALTLLDGEPIEPGPGPHPWGWEPMRTADTR